MLWIKLLFSIGALMHQPQNIRCWRPRQLSNSRYTVATWPKIPSKVTSFVRLTISCFFVHPLPSLPDFKKWQFLIFVEGDAFMTPRVCWRHIFGSLGTPAKVIVPGTATERNNWWLKKWWKLSTNQKLWGFDPSLLQSEPRVVSDASIRGWMSVNES